MEQRVQRVQWVQRVQRSQDLQAQCQPQAWVEPVKAATVSHSVVSCYCANAVATEFFLLLRGNEIVVIDIQSKPQMFANPNQF